MQRLTDYFMSRPNQLSALILVITIIRFSKRLPVAICVIPRNVMLNIYINENFDCDMESLVLGDSVFYISQ